MRIVHNLAIMRVDFLDDIIALLNAGGVTEAARARNVTQPAFSRRIKVLEEALGVDLIDRSAKPSGPSPILREHDRELRRLAADLRRVLAEMRNEQATGAQLLIIACQHAISTSLGAQIVGHLAEPSRLHIRLRSKTLDECMSLLTTRQVGLAVTYRVLSDPGVTELPAFIEEMTIGRDRLVPVCGAQNARALLRRYAEGRLQVIGYPADVFMGQTLAEHVLPQLKEACEIDVLSEVGLTPAAMQLAQAGLGVAWVPHALARPALARGELVDLQASLTAIDMELIARRWRASANAATARAWAKLADLQI